MVKSSAAKLDIVFHALSDSTRRAILRDIVGKQKTVGEIARPYQMSLAAVSKHLNVLESADLITREKRGSFQVIHLNAHAMKKAEHWLRFYENFWDDKLNALQTLLEGKENE
jgi:DNA-binding transcriptional ArsR family regulator